MNERTAVTSGMGAGVVLAGVAATVFDSPETVFGLTPLGAAIYLFVAFALPQGLLARQEQSRDRAAVAVLGVVAAVAVLSYGVLTATLLSPGGGLVGVLLVGIVVAAILGAVRSFRDGYAAARP